MKRHFNQLIESFQPLLLQKKMLSSKKKVRKDGVKEFRNYRFHPKSDQVIDWKRAVWHYLWKFKLSSMCVKKIPSIRCVMI